FLYQTEIHGYLKSGFLTNIDVACSLYKAEKEYVQDRLRDHGEQLFAWLEQGAPLNVSGDANRLAKDVHEAFIDVVSHL
ncbi:sulfite reductase [NADPH] flavoprotein alpha-component, partial [Pseudoalteromonas ruthenica]